MWLEYHGDPAELYQAHCEGKAIEAIIKEYGLPDTVEAEKLALRIYYGPTTVGVTPYDSDILDEADIPF